MRVLNHSKFLNNRVILASPINQDHVNNPFIVVLIVFARLSVVALAYFKVALFKQSLEVRSWTYCAVLSIHKENQLFQS